MEDNGSKFGIGEAIDAIGFGRFQLLVSLFAGFAYMADAMEMMILSILGPALVCQWNITDYNEASLTTVVFLGKLGDKRIFLQSVSHHQC